jgi:hypothetical protein
MFTIAPAAGIATLKIWYFICFEIDSLIGIYFAEIQLFAKYFKAAWTYPGCRLSFNIW